MFLIIFFRNFKIETFKNDIFRTPLKSLLKKQSVDIEEYFEPQCVSDSEVDGRESPKKSVHFSEVDQVIICFLH